MKIFLRALASHPVRSFLCILLPAATLATGNSLGAINAFVFAVGIYGGSAGLSAVFDEWEITRYLWKILLADYWLGAPWFGIIAWIVLGLGFFVRKINQYQTVVAVLALGQVLGSLYYWVKVYPWNEGGDTLGQ